jgi:hypothetical protein
MAARVKETPGQYTGAEDDTKYPKSRLPGYPPSTARVATCSRMPWISPEKNEAKIKVEEANLGGREGTCE